MAIDKGLIGGSTVLLLLSLLERKDYYGYEIIREIDKRSDNVFRYKEGTLYPVLHRMEAGGLLKSYQAETEGGKSRKYYKITAKGKRQLESEKQQWNVFKNSVEQVLGSVGCGYAGV